MAILAMAPGVNTLILESTYCLLHEIALCSTSTQRAAMTLHILVPEIAIDLTGRRREDISRLRFGQSRQRLATIPCRLNLAVVEGLAYPILPSIFLSACMPPCSFPTTPSAYPEVPQCFTATFPLQTAMFPAYASGSQRPA
jgi:hypothetical protein